MTLTSPVHHRNRLDERLLANVTPMTSFCLSQPQRRPDPSVRGFTKNSDVDFHQEIDALARSLALGLCQVLAGERAAAQFSTWFSLDGYDEFMKRYGMVVRHRTRQEKQGKETLFFRRATVLSVHQCHINARCIELSVVIKDAARVRAIALQLKLNSRRRWQITALEIG